MADEWQYLKIGEVAEKVGMGPFGSSIKVSTFVPDGVPVISGEHLRGSRLEDTEYNFITLEHAERLKSANVFRGDVIFTHAGNIGQVAYIPHNSRYQRYVISQRQFYLRCNPRKVVPSFVTYFFKTAEGQHRLLANSSPSGVPSLAQPVTYLRTIEIPVPPVPIQQAIACILGALDDKIELNRRVNETLEAIAQAIFKSWFVDAMRDGLPERWRPGTLGEIAQNPRRSLRPERIEPDTPYIGLEHMPRRSIALSEWGVADELESNKFEFKQREILFGKLRPYFHKVGVAPLDGVCSTDILVVAPINADWLGFLLGHISSAVFVEYTNASSTGTKMPRTNWSDMARYELPLPPESLAASYTKTIRPAIERIIANIMQSRTLAALRDALLPKLISGELRVPDVERIIGRCA